MNMCIDRIIRDIHKSSQKESIQKGGDKLGIKSKKIDKTPYEKKTTQIIRNNSTENFIKFQWAWII